VTQKDLEFRHACSNQPRTP